VVQYLGNALYYETYGIFTKPIPSSIAYASSQEGTTRMVTRCFFEAKESKNCYTFVYKTAPFCPLNKQKEKGKKPEL